MCVTVASGKLSDTIVLAAETERDGKTSHLLGYQNQPLSRAGPNAMILPVPAIPGTVAQADFILTEDFPNVLKDMVRSGRTTSVEIPADRAMSKEVVVFEHGIYTIVLAQSAGAIPEAYTRVPEGKRPPLNTALFEAYEQWYPGWAVAVCCFDTARAHTTEPILLTYTPQFPDLLFVPALDSHTGDVPDREAQVRVDHSVVVSALELDFGFEVSYSDPIPAAVEAMLPRMVLLQGFGGSLPNGDWWYPLDEVQAGSLDPVRVAPPYPG